MAGRERYYLQRDEAQSRRDIRESEERAARSRGGINTFRGIGRGLGMLAGLALAPATAGTSMLAMAGGLGSLGGSLAGGAAGKHKYGGPEKADVGLFNRDVAREQRKGVDQYWKGLKEQTVTNALQDAVTAGMYGTKIKEGISEFGGKVRQGMDELKLLGQPKVAMPTSPKLLEANTAGIIPDYQQQQLGQYLDQIKQSNAANLMTPTADVAGANIGSAVAAPTTAAAATQYTQGINYKDVVGKNQLVVDPNNINVDPLKSDMARGVDQRVADAIDVSPDVGVQTGFKNQTMAVDETRAALDNAGPYGKNVLFPKETVTSGYNVAGNPMGAVGSGPMPSPNFLGDAVNNTNLTPNTSMQQRILDYKNKNWAADDTIDMDLWNQISGLDNINIPYISGGY